MIVCRICGSEKLMADPAGYYEHAFSLNGAPLMCQDWNISRESQKAHSMYPCDWAGSLQEKTNEG